MQSRFQSCRLMFVVFGLIYALIASVPVWAAIPSSQWTATWEKSGDALEDAIKDKKLLKKVRKTAASSKISSRLTRLTQLDKDYAAAQDKFFKSNAPKDLKKWKKVLKQFQKEMHGLAKAKNKYLAGMKKIMANAKGGADVQGKYSYHKKTLKAIESGVRYHYGRNASNLEQNATEAKDGQEMLSRQETIKIKTMKAGLRNGAADINKGIAKAQSKPRLKTYRKHLAEDIRTVRGLLAECRAIDAIPNPSQKLYAAFDGLEKELQGKRLETEAKNLVEKSKQPRDKAEEMVVLRQIAELDKANRALKKYVKKLGQLKI